jgi:hypothetical protein
MPKRTKFQIRSDAAKQRWHVRDDHKESFWRRHLEKWSTSGLSKRGYCRENDLAYSSFMAWRREIELRDREQVPPANVVAHLSKSVEKTANLFVPIRLVPEQVQEKKQEEAPVKSTADQQQIEIALPSGAVIKLHDGCDARFVANLLSALKA